MRIIILGFVRFVAVLAVHQRYIGKRDHIAGVQDRLVHPFAVDDVPPWNQVKIQLRLDGRTCMHRERAVMITIWWSARRHLKHRLGQGNPRCRPHENAAFGVRGSWGFCGNVAQAQVEVCDRFSRCCGQSH